MFPSVVQIYLSGCPYNFEIYLEKHTQAYNRIYAYTYV